MDERTFVVELTECEILYIASAMSDRVHKPGTTIEDSTYAGKIWHKIVPNEWKEQVIQ